MVVFFLRKLRVVFCGGILEKLFGMLLVIFRVMGVGDDFVELVRFVFVIILFWR